MDRWVGEWEVVMVCPPRGAGHAEELQALQVCVPRLGSNPEAVRQNGHFHAPLEVIRSSGCGSVHMYPLPMRMVWTHPLANASVTIRRRATISRYCGMHCVVLQSLVTEVWLVLRIRCHQRSNHPLVHLRGSLEFLFMLIYAKEARCCYTSGPDQSSLYTMILAGVSKRNLTCASI